MSPVVVGLGTVDPALVTPYLPEGTTFIAEPSPADLATAYGAIVRADAVVDADLLDRMTGLRVLARTGVGTDLVDLATATARGIPVVVTPGSGTDAVAEGAIAMALCLVKQLRRTTELVRDGRWAERGGLTVGDLGGATMGIVGFGRIGRATGWLAEGFGMRVLAYDPHAEVDAPAAPASLAELAGASDVISLHLPLTAETRHLVGEEFLGQVKPGAVLINCGRGGLVDLDAVHAALLDGRLSGVGLDVFDPEPPAHHPIFDHPDVVLSPHLMGLTRRATAATFADAALGIAAMLAGEEPAAVANPEWIARREATRHIPHDQTDKSQVRTRDMTGNRIAGAPISWGVCEVPGWGYQLSPERVLADMQELGLAATELGPDGFLPGDPTELAAVLAAHQLQAVGGFTPFILHRRDIDPLDELRRLLPGFVAARAEVMVLSADTGLGGYDSRPELDDDDWALLLGNLDRIRAAAGEHGIQTVLHPHVGTMVENTDDVQRVLEGSTIQLCLDTGHLLIGGTDPAELTRQVPDRIAHTHLKDVDLGFARKVQAGRLTYTEAVRDGMYRPLGAGDVDVEAIVGHLEAHGYTGWYTLEQDTILTEAPADEGPVADVRTSAAYVRSLLER